MSEIDDSFPVSLDLIVTRKRMAAAGEDPAQRKLGVEELKRRQQRDKSGEKVLVQGATATP